MKITKYPDRMRSSVPHQNCPCCGETRSFQIMGNKFIGTDYISTRIECKGFIRTKLIYTDLFMCHTCGAHWEGDPYEKEY